jgi:hypothetical protein
VAVSTDVAPVPRPGRAPSASACEPYRELIAEALGRGRHAMAIWQDLVDDLGTRKDYLTELATVPLLIIDDLGMRKLAHTPPPRIYLS